MCQSFSYDTKWSVHSIKNIMKKIYKNAIKKLNQSVKTYLGKKISVLFSNTDEDVNILMEN